MTDVTDAPYQMTIGLNVLKHLGFGLYSNVPAVLAEVVANAWDADAEHVSIDIDADTEQITIRDDGHGMTVQDANDRYLYVGYERRKRSETAMSPRFKRPVMGRKGIGKLSLFSIADRVTVRSKRGGETHGFIMDANEIEKAIGADDVGEYYPDPLGSEVIDLPTESGTEITLNGLKRRLNVSSVWLRRRLARRFSMIGEAYRFRIDLDGVPITIADRGYHDKLQYVWTFGSRGEEVATMAKLKPVRRPVEIDYADGCQIEGWIGTARRAGDLKDEDGESLNKIVVMVRDKLAQEDILEEFGEGGVYSRYLIGEIHADFLDIDDEDDIQTTSRQRIIEEDPRYQALRSKVRTELKAVQNQWTNLRNEEGKGEAVKIPEIDQWYRSLDQNHRPAARRLFGRINKLPIEDPAEKRQLFIGAILAFESLRFRHLVERLDDVSEENLGALGAIFGQLDDLEASAYYQISKDRLAVIEKLTGLTDDNAKERAMQEHLFQHLWLLDPSWERATHTVRMEQSVKSALDGVTARLTESQKRARVDIQYSTTGNKHVVIELKRAGRRLDTAELVEQIQKYNGAVRNALDALDRGNEPLEFICVIGRPLRDWSDLGGRERSERTLDGQNARVVRYDALIQNAQEAYKDYLERQQDAGRVYALITSISTADVEAMHSSAPESSEDIADAAPSS